ncbi:MAG: glycosyltransferase, partial [Elusimicrobiota bacterium]
MNTRLSFIVMTVDREALLRRCLDSLSGPPPGVEVLVVFNGSPAEMRASVARDYPWARALALEPCSLGEGRNRGARAAGGEMRHFLDDDTSAPVAAAAADLFGCPDGDDRWERVERDGRRGGRGRLDAARLVVRSDAVGELPEFDAHRSAEAL